MSHHDKAAGLRKICRDGEISDKVAAKLAALA
jgi:hypothetical protein